MPKLIYLLALLSMIPNPTLAAEPVLAESQVKAAMEVLKDAKVGEVNTGDRLVKIGIVAAAGGLSVYGAGFSMMSLTKSRVLARTAGVRLATSFLANSGALVFVGGLATIELGVILEVMWPVEAHAATLDEYFLHSDAGLQRFLALPIEQQWQFVRTSRPLQVAVVALASEVLHQASE